MARGPLPLPVSLDPDGPTPLHVQLREGLRAAILDRRLPRGGRLPASRVMAADLGCARGTVVLALEQLIAEGYLTARRRCMSSCASACARRSSTAGCRAGPGCRPPG
jgi:GntR family transcriptional regulator/MocR family aminotransferase